MSTSSPKVYLDNNVTSALAKNDTPSVSDELLHLLGLAEGGRLQLVTSEVSRREFEKLEHVPNIDRDRWNLRVVYYLLAKVEFVEDHKLLGMHVYIDRYTCINSPMIEDDSISAALRQIGLERADAHHLMIAIRNTCEVFLTFDRKTILKYRREIERQFPIKVRNLSELIAELGSIT